MNERMNRAQNLKCSFGGATDTEILAVRYGESANAERGGTRDGSEGMGAQERTTPTRLEAPVRPAAGREHDLQKVAPRHEVSHRDSVALRLVPTGETVVKQ